MTKDKEINLGSLMNDLREATTNASIWGGKMALSEDAYNCVWGGQTSDGRKRQLSGSKEPFPWVGASDTRVRVVKEKVQELEALCDSVFRKSRMQFVGIDSMDKIKTHRINQLLRWQMNNQISRGSRRELALARRYMFKYGVSLLSVTWERRERMGLEVVTLENLLERKQIPMQAWSECVSNPAGFYASLQNVNIPTDDDIILTECYQLYSVINNEDESSFVAFFQKEFNVKEGRAKKAVKNFKEKGFAEMPKLRVVKDAPVYEAFVPFKNVFFPVDTKDINKASWIAVRKWYSKEEIESNEDFTAVFKDLVLKSEGKSSTEDIDKVRSNFLSYKDGKTSSFLYQSNAKKNYEIFEFYYKKVVDGVEEIHKAVMSAHAMVDSTYVEGTSELYDDHSEGYPFIVFEFNPTSDCLLDSEGLPELIYTQQLEIKNMRDARVNVCDISVLPPIRRNIRDQGSTLSLGPARDVFERIEGSTQWMNPPENRTALAIELEHSVKADVDRFSGCFNKSVPPETTSIIQAYTSNIYLDIMREVLISTFKLNQLYMPATLITRITGMSPQPFEMSKEEIQGSFDIILSFDSDELNPEYAEKKAHALSEVLKEDYNGVIDKNKAVALKLNLIDPIWAELLITDENNGARLEMEEEQKNLSLIMTGQEPEMKEGVNPRIRLEYLNSMCARSPKVIEELNRNEFVRTLFENRRKHLTHLIQQEENARIGRLGTAEIMQ